MKYLQIFFLIVMNAKIKLNAIWYGNFIGPDEVFTNIFLIVMNAKIKLNAIWSENVCPHLYNKNELKLYKFMIIYKNNLKLIGVKI
jgi:hypothetical protein